MKTKRLFGVMIMAVWLTGSAAPAQQPSVDPIYPPPSPVAPHTSEKLPEDRRLAAGGGLSDWIVYGRECCEGPLGAATPLYSEFYLQAGASIPVGGMTLSRELKTGWSITGGVRALFFNEPHTRAWVVDAHIINTNQSAGVHDTQFPITFFQNGTRSDLVVFEGAIGRKTFSIQNSNRTLVGLGLGRDWYLGQPAHADSCKWRFGVDGGGRWGSHRVNFSEFGHVTDVIGSVYAGAHGDVEYPWRNWVFHTGVRLEWAYTWSDILQQTSDVQDISIFLTMGVRW